MISLQNCTKLFGHTLALNSVSISISGPGLVLLLGSNGAGKSTFLRACAGLLTPSSGSIDCVETVSYLGHQVMLYPQLTVAENLKFFLSLGEKSVAALDHDWLELGELSNKFVSDLSQGQKSRVALSRALQADASTSLLLDEPSTAFDLYWQKLFTEKLRQLSSERLIMMVTHDPEKYLDFASRVLIFAHGAIVQDFKLTADSNRTSVLQAYSEVLR